MNTVNYILALTKIVKIIMPLRALSISYIFYLAGLNSPTNYKQASMALPIRNVLFLTVLLLLRTTCEAQLVKHKTYLRISNYMAKKLTVHCKSKDDDIGVQILAPQASFEFSFRPNFWNSTLYFCQFIWEGGSHWFDIYVQTRDQHACVKHCNWFVTKTGSGVCRLIEGEPHLVEKCFPWNDESSHH